MRRLTVTHEIACTPERFWTLYFDSDFTRTLIVDGLGFGACDIVRRDETEQEIRRETVAQPRIELPEVVAKVIGTRFTYRETGRFDKRAGTWTFDTVLGVLPDKIKLGGTMITCPVGTDHCQRQADLWVDVKIFGVGGVIEKAAESSLRRGWDDSAGWLNGWLQRQA